MHVKVKKNININLWKLADQQIPRQDFCVKKHKETIMYLQYAIKW